MRLHAFGKCALNRIAGPVFKMDDAGNRVAGLRRQIEFLRIFRRWIKWNSKLVDQYFFHEARALMTEQRGRFRRTEPRACNQDVGHELLGLLATPAINNSAL